MNSTQSGEPRESGAGAETSRRGFLATLMAAIPGAVLLSTSKATSELHIPTFGVTRDAVLVTSLDGEIPAGATSVQAVFDETFKGIIAGNPIEGINTACLGFEAHASDFMSAISYSVECGSARIAITRNNECEFLLLYKEPSPQSWVEASEAELTQWED